MTIKRLVSSSPSCCWPRSRRSSARNIELSTDPHSEDTVQLTIYNSEDLTLVRETRRITFKRGMNPLQFSWANTLIDPSSSVDLRFRTHGSELDLLDTTYPSRQTADAVLERAERMGRRRGGRDHLLHVGNHLVRRLPLRERPAESHDGLRRVTYASPTTRARTTPGAQIRLVVGTINLVEQVSRAGPARHDLEEPKPTSTARVREEAEADARGRAQAS